MSSTSFYKWRTTLIHIQPVNLQQNAYVERYHRAVRYGWLIKNLFGSLQEVQEGATKWLWTYSNERSHKPLGRLNLVQKRNPHLLTRSAKKLTAKNGGITDQGPQYSSCDFGKLLDSLNMEADMSRRDNC